MILVIDGYNLLRHLFLKEKGKLDKQRKQLIRNLGFYKKKKKWDIEEFWQKLSNILFKIDFEVIIHD